MTPFLSISKCLTHTFRPLQIPPPPIKICPAWKFSNDAAPNQSILLWSLPFNTYTSNRSVPSSSFLSPSSYDVPSSSHSLQHCQESYVQTKAFMTTYVEDNHIINVYCKYDQAWIFRKEIMEKILLFSPKIWYF